MCLSLLLLLFQKVLLIQTPDPLLVQIQSNTHEVFMQTYSWGMQWMFAINLSDRNIKPIKNIKSQVNQKWSLICHLFTT